MMINNPWVNEHLLKFETFFDDYLSALETSSSLKGAMKYSALNGGKRVRPLMVLAAGRLSHASPEVLYPICAAIEAIHCYSLIHDDLPAMDNDTMRRGKPSCHIQFDEATAILAGDALLTESFSILANLQNISPETALRLIQILADASGAKGMVNGQMLDLLANESSASLEQLKNIHKLKTGKLIKASILMGFIAGEQPNAETEKMLSTFADHIGLAFQIQDDILDATSTSESLGKTAGKDQSQAKATYVSLLGIDKAKKTTTELLTQAIELIAPYGNQAEQLQSIAKFTIQRSH